MNCVFVCTVCKLSRRRALLKFALNNRQSAFLQRDLCSMFVLVTHVKFCSLWRHQFTVSEMEAIPACGVSKGSALRLRLTGSVVQPLSYYDLLTYKAIGSNYLSFVVTSMLVFHIATG